MFGENLKRARAAAGLSMQALAEKVGVSANMIKKYEHGASMPSSPVLLSLSRALDVQPAYFLRPTRVTLEHVEYRKRSSTPARVMKQIQAEVHHKLENWCELEALWPHSPIPAFDPEECWPQARSSNPEDLAEAVRHHWGLGSGPVPHLVDLLESKGIRVLISNVNHGGKFDGLQTTVGSRPVVVVSSLFPGDRQRFTLAHELGHLLLEGKLPAGMNEEQACNHFASAFLLPKTVVFDVLGKHRSSGISLPELAALKQKYGMSIIACLYRAASLGVITEHRKKTDLIAMSRKGWRKQEPYPYPCESSVLFESLVYRALSEDIISESKAAELLAITQHTLVQNLSIQNIRGL